MNKDLFNITLARTNDKDIIAFIPEGIEIEPEELLIVRMPGGTIEKAESVRHDAKISDGALVILDDWSDFFESGCYGFVLGTFEENFFRDATERADELEHCVRETMCDETLEDEEDEKLFKYFEKLSVEVRAKR
jgi:hypothetical protein